MTIVYIIMIVLGCYFLLMGLNSRKQQKIRVANEKMLGPVSKEDRKQYATTLGKGWEFIGFGLIVGAVINMGFNTSYGWIVSFAGFLIGLILMVYCDYRLKQKQKKETAAKERKKLEQQQKKAQQKDAMVKNRNKKKKK